MDIAILENWLQELKNKKIKIDNDILHIEALIVSNKEGVAYIKPATPNIERKSSGKINKGKIIASMCRNMTSRFSSTDIKEILSNNENEQIRNITLGYVSHILGKLEKETNIFLVEKGTGRGSPNYYSIKKEDITE